MIGFLIRRILQAAIVVLIVTVIVFILLRSIPGNVAVAILGPSAYRNPATLAQFNAQYGFDKPWYSQYLLGWATCSRATSGSHGRSTSRSRRCSGSGCRRPSSWSGSPRSSR